MLISKRVIFVTNALRRRLIQGSRVFSTAEEQHVFETIKPFDKKKLLDLSKSSVKSYVNEDKIDILKKFYHVQSETTCTYNFVIDDYVAKDIASNVVTDEKRKKGILAEGNPGLGLITVNLINSGASQILTFDSSEIQEVSLNQMITSHPEKIRKNVGNMNKNVDAILLNSVDAGLKHHLPVTVVGVTTSFYFFRGLVLHFVKYNLWQNDLTIFLAVSTQVLQVITQNKCQVRFKFYIHGIFRLFFTVEKVAVYPREAFLPSSKEKNDMHLIKVSVNPDAFNIISQEEITEYFVFLRILGSRLSNFIIPTLEKWLPDCGPYLIAKGVSMTTQVQDLSYEEATRLYYFCKNCEGYSYFKACTEKVF